VHNRHRKEEERRISDIARCQSCKRLGHTASECRTLAFEKRDEKSEGNRLTSINNADRRFRNRSEALPPYRNDDSRRPYPPYNTVHNNRNNGLEITKNQSSWQKREDHNKYTWNLNTQDARRTNSLSGIKN
jgi:hypothetical protein